MKLTQVEQSLLNFGTLESLIEKKEKELASWLSDTTSRCSDETKKHLQVVIEDLKKVIKRLNAVKEA